MEKLFERQNRLENRVSRLDNGEHIKHLTNRVKHVEMASLYNIMNIRLLTTEILSSF